MPEKISQTFEKIIFGVPVVYLLGYIIFNLNLYYNYGIYETDIANFNFLKAGLLFLFLIFPVFIIVKILLTEPTDDLSKNWKSQVAIFYYTLLYGCLWSILTTQKDFQFISNIQNLGISSTVFISLIPILFIVRKYKNLVLLFTVLLLIIVCYMLYFMTKYAGSNLWLPIILLSSSWFIANALGRIGDKTYSASDKWTDGILTIATVYIFSINVYQSIPQAIGGGKPVEYHFQTRLGDSLYFSKMGIHIENDLSFRAKLIYFSSQTTCFKIDSSIYKLNNEYIVGIKNKIPSRNFIN